MSAKKLFISYSHADEDPYLKNLLTHLRPLERRNVVSPWFDGHILPGQDLDEKIAEALNGSDIIVLLVSPHFMASDYCYTTEMEAAIERHRTGAAHVIPVIVRDCQWKTAPFARIKVLPKDGRAMATFAYQNADAEWTRIAEAIEAVAILANPPPPAQARSNTVTSLGLPPDQPKNLALGVKPKSRFTDLDKDDFKHASFDEIATLFEQGLVSLQPPLLGRFRRVDANRFTATIYDAGQKVSGCTVWINGSSFAQDSIAYVGNDRAETNSMNEWLSVLPSDGELVLQPQMSSIGSGDRPKLSAREAAKFLWAKFTERVD